MTEKILYDLVTDGGRLKPYSIPGSSELDGMEFMSDEALAVKCEEGLFLVFSDGRALFYDQVSGGELTDLDTLRQTPSTMPEEFLAWETEFSVAPGRILKARFSENAVDIEGTFFPLKVVRAGEKQYLLLFTCGASVFFDAKRFLLYSAADGRVVTGYVEVPAAR